MTVFVRRNIVSARFSAEPRPYHGGGPSRTCVWLVTFDCGHAARVTRNSTASRPRPPKSATCLQCGEEAAEADIYGALDHNLVNLMRGEWLKLDSTQMLLLPGDCLLVLCDMLEEKSDPRCHILRGMVDISPVPDWFDVSGETWRNLLPEIWAAWLLATRAVGVAANRNSTSLFSDGVNVSYSEASDEN